MSVEEGEWTWGCVVLWDLSGRHFVSHELNVFVSSRTGFPNDPAADIALNTVRDWLKENKDKVRAVHFS